MNKLFADKQYSYLKRRSASFIVRRKVSDAKIKTVFNQFETDASGNITRENVCFAMHKLGQDVSEQDLSEMLDKHDKSRDRTLSYDEFKVKFKES